MLNKIFYRGFVLVALMLVSIAIPRAQNKQQILADTLASTTTWECEFTLMAIGEWKDGKTTPELKTASLSLGFQDVEAEEGSANTVGGFGPPHIITRLSATSLHFMQVSREGPLYVTTIFAKESNPENFLAVHTRHEFTEISLPGFTSKPEQYYGECVVAE